MPSLRPKAIELVAMAKCAEKALKTMSRAAKAAARLSTAELYGCFGAMVGFGAMFVVLAMGSWLVYGTFLVPIAGCCGLIMGGIIGRDRIDRVNERTIHVIDQLWALRDRDLGHLAKQIDEARRTNPNFSYCLGASGL